MRNIIIVLVAVVSFQGALASDFPVLELDSRTWMPISSTSSHDFADVTYQLASENSDSSGLPDQFLRIAIAKDAKAFLEMERQLLSGFQHAASVSEQPALGNHSFSVREARVLAPLAEIPEFVVVTAYENKSFDYRLGIQYAIKPRCQRCLQAVESFKQHFAKAKVDDEATVLSFATAHVDLRGLRFSSDQKSFFRSIYDNYMPHVIGFGASVAIFASKFILSAMGFYKCPTGAPVCVCTN